MRSHHHEIFFNTQQPRVARCSTCGYPSILIGFVLGVISGLISGIHTDNFALILLALSPPLSDLGFSNIHIAAMILANSVTHTFLNIIPAVYLGAPDAGTALAVLPGQDQGVV